MKASTPLIEEHHGIKRMLQILEAVSRRIEGGEPVDPQDLEQIVEFIQVFADSCHHAKEEELLFEAMVEAGLPREGGPIGVMLHEHVLGRGYVRAVKEALPGYQAGDAAAAVRIAENARSYAALLHQHIDKEDHILYPMADRQLPAQKQHELVEAFERVEEERIGPGRHEAFHALLDRLEATYLPAAGAR